MSDAKMRSLDEALRKRESYLEAVVLMQRRLLLTESDELGALNDALEPLGEASGASRVYLFENHYDEQGTLLVSQRAEWCAPSVIPEIDNPELQDLPYAEVLPRWAATLETNTPINGLVVDFPEAERELLDPQGILALLVLPFHVDGRFMGFVGFDNCDEAKVWSELEVNLLSVAATNIGLMLDQRRARRRLMEVNEQLESARDEALMASEAKSAFLAKVSHELRTPLNAVIGYSELLLDEPDALDLDQWTGDVKRILSSGQHLLSVINDLLDISRAEAGKLILFPRKLDLDQFVEDLADSVARLGRRNDNAFHLIKPPKLGVIEADEIRLRQILLNLLSNAFKYTQHGKVQLRVGQEGDAMLFCVEDNGIGMEEDQLERIFEAFVQADDSPTRAFEGTGLGLSITKHLCELMHATVEVTSTPGQGSCFKVRLPLKQRGGVGVGLGAS